ncbi:hypothetical protein VaNZ11_002599 [Volvox africanus]|uniref:Bromo domain-containing protein n=1 Tax=Volvox africanus TaxID=51714 RepID=A0ABQ5RT00_9CHLO|nr:hypothetical protein VaNZ11_002599 [Volvox africanus]
MMRSDKSELEDKAWRGCKGAINSIWQSPHSWCFREPVDEEKHGAPNYYALIKDPQDLLTIRTRLENGKFKSPLEVNVAVRKMCENAFTYNAEDHDVHKAARSVLAQWMDLWDSRNVAALWAAAQDPASRAALCHTLSGRRATAGASGSAGQQQQQPQQQQQLLLQNKLLKQQNHHHPLQQRARQQSVPLGGAAEKALQISLSQPQSREPSPQPPDRMQTMQGDGLAGSQQLASVPSHGQQHQHQPLQLQVQKGESASQAQQSARQVSPSAQSLHQQQRTQQQMQQQQQQRLGERRTSKPTGSRSQSAPNSPLNPFKILQFHPDILSGSDHSPVPLLLSLLRAATWLPQLFLSCGRLKAQMLGGCTSDPELLHVRCLCSECGSQLLPGYMPLTHFYMHSRGAEGDAAGLDEATTPSASDAEAEGRAAAEGEAGAAGGGDGGGGSFGGSGAGGPSRSKARVRVADMESLKRRVWSFLRCGGKLETAGEVPFLEMVRQRAEAAGGAALIGRRVWVYHFSDFLKPPNNLFGTWQPTTILGYNSETGEHELRYDLDPQGPTELVQLAVNFLHFGETHPAPGFRPLGPNGEVSNTEPHLATCHTYFASSAADGSGETQAPLVPVLPQTQTHAQAQQRHGLSGSQQKTPAVAAAAAVTAAVSAAAAFVASGPQSTAAHLRSVIGNACHDPAAGHCVAPGLGDGLGPDGLRGSGGGAAPGIEPGSAANAIVIESDEDDTPALATQRPPGVIISPFSLRLAAQTVGQSPHATGQGQGQHQAHQQQQLPPPQQQQQRLLYLNAYGTAAAATVAAASAVAGEGYTPAPHPTQQHRAAQDVCALPGAMAQVSAVSAGSLPAGGGIATAAGVAAARRASGGGTCGVSNAVAGRLVSQPVQPRGATVGVTAAAAGGGATTAPAILFYRRLMPIYGDPKIDTDSDRKYCHHAAGRFLTQEQRRLWDTGTSADRQQLLHTFANMLDSNPSLESKIVAVASEYKRRSLQKYQAQQQQQQQPLPHYSHPQTQPYAAQQQPQQQQQASMNGVGVRQHQQQALQQQQQQQLQAAAVAVAQQQHLMMRQFHNMHMQQEQHQQQQVQHQQQMQQQQVQQMQQMQQQQVQQMQQHQQHQMQHQMQQHQQRLPQQQAFLHTAAAGYISPGATAGPALGTYNAHPSVQMPHNLVVQRPQSGTGATPSPQQPLPTNQCTYQQPGRQAPYPPQPGGPAAMSPYVQHLMAQRPPPQPSGVAAVQTSESAEHQAKRQRFDSAGAADYVALPQSAAGGAAPAQPPQPLQPLQPQPQSLSQPGEQPIAQQHSVSPPSQPMQVTAASSGGRGSVSGGAGEECAAGGIGSGGGGGAGGGLQTVGSGRCSAGGGRFRPMAAHLTDVIDITRALVDLMEQLPLHLEKAREVRKALRLLQASGKDKYIQMAYVTLCSAAKMGDEEEIRDTFEEFCREAARCQ